ncbi:hypothetical protein G5714_024082 [Onychostoma macrolepis]|uniref:Uncharacterized protein n=1 Tax=Onychostoma macrolepis TaxID=369639 RepID=A0A7J6BJD8_9TELE|nr:hypothetical protein G5714_024082 [Onychostoma macrolepis]
MEGHHSPALKRDAEIESFVSDFAVFMEVEGLNGSLLDVHCCAGDFYSLQRFGPQFDLLSKGWHVGDLDRSRMPVVRSHSRAVATHWRPSPVREPPPDF